MKGTSSRWIVPSRLGWPGPVFGSINVGFRDRIPIGKNLLGHRSLRHTLWLFHFFYWAPNRTGWPYRTYGRGCGCSRLTPNPAGPRSSRPVRTYRPQRASLLDHDRPSRGCPQRRRSSRRRSRIAHRRCAAEGKGGITLGGVQKGFFGVAVMRNKRPLGK